MDFEVAPVQDVGDLLDVKSALSFPEYYADVGETYLDPCVVVPDEIALEFSRVVTMHLEAETGCRKTIQKPRENDMEVGIQLVVAVLLS